MAGVPEILGDSSDMLEPIAIIGLSHKFPQDADTPASFWRMLEEKRCAMTEWPMDRIKLDAFFHRDGGQDHRIFVQGANFVKEDLGAFDAQFFGISATEAMVMDPQHRILLETAYRALENAGIPMEKVHGSKTGVYSGSMANDYTHVVTKDVDDLPKSAATGVSMNMVANRLSWFFNFTGPSINLDSACSSSLMALDFAVQGLRNRDSNMALVAGGSMVLAIEGVVPLIKMSFLSPQGRCHSFDERANGYSKGEGFGVILVKRLSDAIKDGNTIRAVIRSTGSNQDGHTPGITQPNKDSQAVLIQETYKKANLDLGPTRFFEAHGTGTAIGDPIEADAIGAAFRTIRSPEDPLYIGALKANIGHLEGGSGVASLIKTIMVLERGVIPPNANFERLNPRIDAEFLNLQFPLECTPWPTEGLRRASVNSFGFGGSNAHAVLDDACHFLRSRGLTANHCTVDTPPLIDGYGYQQNLSNGKISTPGPKEKEISIIKLLTNGSSNRSSEADGNMNSKCHSNSHHTPEEMSTPRIFVWSAADEGGIDRLAEKWQDYFVEMYQNPIPPGVEYLENIAHTLAARRSSLPWKSFAIADSLVSLTKLKDLISRPARSSEALGMGFIFTGQGAAYNRMGLALLEYPVFKDTLHSCDKVLQELGCQWSVVDELRRQETSTFIHGPDYSQSLTTALQIALVELLRSFDIVPSTVVGHSSGEIAAAYSASGLSLESACKVSYHRGRLASTLKKSGRVAGAMISVDLSEDEMDSYLRRASIKMAVNDLYIACINSLKNVTVSGDEKAVDLLKARLDFDHIAAQKLRTGVAYHSPHMKEIEAEYAASLQDLQKGNAQLSRRVTMISSVTGNPINRLDLLSKPEYWVSNMVQPVKYLAAISRMVSPIENTRRLGVAKQHPVYDLIEIGPHSALQRPTRSVLENTMSKVDMRYFSALSRKKSAIDTVIDLSGHLYLLGYPVALDEVNRINKDHTSGARAIIDLPEYPFNHSRTYWHESSLNRHSRLRIHHRLELLGTPVPDWNPLEPRWRKFFDVTETPWIEDHRVKGKPIYPATGMVVMAIEGARQLADPHRTIKGYHIKDATFSHPIVISPTERTEVQLAMRPVQSTSKNDPASFEYRIYSRSGEEWQENCRGLINVQHESPQNALDSQEKENRRAQSYRDQYLEAVDSCSYSVEPERMYQQFDANGLNYGSAFRAMSNLAWDGKCKAVVRLKTFEWNSRQSQHVRQSHIVHPTTLDAAGQMMWLALTRGGTKTLFDGVAVTRIKSLWISNSGLSYPGTTELQACSTSRLKGLRGTDSSMFALDHLGNLKIRVDHMETTSVSADKASVEYPDPRQICFNMVWKPDLDLMTSKQILSYCKGMIPCVTKPASFYQDLGYLLIHYAQQTLDRTRDVDPASLKPHMRKYVAWLKMQVVKNTPGQLDLTQDHWTPSSCDSELMDSIARRIERSNAEGKFFVTVGRNLESIIRGTLDPLEIMFNGDLAVSHYQELCDKTSSCRQLWGFLDALSHKNPGMKIVEIGAGTGSITSHILAPLMLHGELENGTPKFSEYDYTDISDVFFEQARNKFTATKKKMRFKVMNIEVEPRDQGYREGSYDLVIAGWVLHATRDLDTTVRNVRRLLKPGGKLVLLELTRPEVLWSGFAFGTLPGWWLSIEKYREWSPCVSEDQWHQILSSNGFSGVDLVLPDYSDGDFHESSIMVATATKEDDPSLPREMVTLIVDPDSSIQTAVAENVRQLRSMVGHSDCEVVPIQNLASGKPSKNTTLVFLTELERPFLYNLEERSLRLLQDLVKSVDDILWITAANKTAVISAQAGMVTGFSRVLCTEDSNLSFVTVTFEEQKGEQKRKIEEWSRKIAQILALNRNGISEMEYTEREGMMMINRLFEARYLNHELHAMSRPTVTVQDFGKAPPLALSITNPGSLDSLQFVEDLKYHTDLAPDEVEIEVKSVGVNFRDLVVLLGKHPGDSLGCECAGVITRVGTDCTSVKPGDRVCAVTLGCVSTYTRCNFELVVKIPENLSYAEAASLPVIGVTAHYSLIVIAGLQQRESVLIHSGAGGTGQMAIQIAQAIGAEVFATVGSEEKRQLLKEVYHIAEDHIFYSRDASFAQDIMRMTNNCGVDVILNSLSGESLVASWESIAPFGRFIELGKMDIEANTKLPMSHFAKNVSFTTVAVDHMCTNRPSLLRKSLVSIMERITAGSLSIVSPLREYHLSQIEAAFRFMQGGMSTGKLVLNLSPTDGVPMLLNHTPSYTLDPTASYLIAGGLGGLGRSAARWMAERGAKNLILLSRSGPKSQAAVDLLRELRAFGVRVKAPRCDVSSAESLLAALQECTTLPPIKGCIQGAMVLKDSVFGNMSFTDWTVSIQSKVHSTFNLHTLLPPDLSFFIILSSVAGIVGSPGQANYAAGNTYQDALVQHRLSLGLKATSIDLGWMSKVGIVAENAKYTRGKEAAIDLVSVSEDEFLALLEYYCDPKLDYEAKSLRSQPIVGLVSPMEFRAKGIEVPMWMDRPLFAALAQMGGQDELQLLSGEALAAGQTDYVAEFLQASTAAEAADIVVRGLLQKLARALSVAEEELDVDRPLHVHGVDSLLAVELRNWFAKVWKADVAVFDITGQASILALGAHIAKTSRLGAEKDNQVADKKTYSNGI